MMNIIFSFLGLTMVKARYLYVFYSGYATSGDVKDLTRAIRKQNDRNR